MKRGKANMCCNCKLWQRWTLRWFNTKNTRKNKDVYCPPVRCWNAFSHIYVSDCGCNAQSNLWLKSLHHRQRSLMTNIDSLRGANDCPADLLNVMIPLRFTQSNVTPYCVYIVHHDLDCLAGISLCKRLLLRSSHLVISETSQKHNGLFRLTCLEIYLFT